MKMLLLLGRLIQSRTARFTCLVCAAAMLLVVLLAACSPSGQATASITPPQTPPISNLPSSTLSPTGEIVPVQAQSASPTPSTTSVPASPAVTYTPTPLPSPTPPESVTFAAIGDFGSGDKNEGKVADLILSWKPEFIISLGDNNYPSGSADHIDAAIGQFFHSFIYPYPGSYGSGSDINRFFPCLGNHDVLTDKGKPYLDYFTLPGNERYYDFTWGPVHFFALDSIETEPDGVGVSSIQAEWLKSGLASSTSPWNIVYMHYPPYSSGEHGSTDWARWPYAEWGADAVLAGHDHDYERLEEGGLVYFVNGLGGGGIYDFGSKVDGSQGRYNRNYGAMKVVATGTSLEFEFINITGRVVDTYELKK